MIPQRPPDHCQVMAPHGEAATASTLHPRPGAPGPVSRERTPEHRRARALVTEFGDFVWRSLRRLGIAEAECDDGCQRVWLVVTQKLAQIEPGKERSYLFSVAMRVASGMRRTRKLGQEVLDEQLTVDSVGKSPEELCAERRARELLDQILARMSWELRTVFVMFELEGFSSPEIAESLGLSRGTIASRLRLARVAFEQSLERLRPRPLAPLPATLPPATLPVRKTLAVVLLAVGGNTF